MEKHAYVKSNYDALVAEIGEYEKKYSRSITLVSVTKSGTDEELVALCRAGAANIGENRPGELRRRADLLREAGYTPTLHEIGNLQRNKVKYIIADVALIHSLDSLSLAEEIEKQAVKVGRRVPVLVEINSGREENKGGILPEEAEEFIASLSAYPSLTVSGLMTMGPVCEPEEARIYFRETKKLFDSLKEKGAFVGDGILSMGMSDSYRVAIEEGSTLVRVGRKLFENKN